MAITVTPDIRDGAELSRRYDPLLGLVTYGTRAFLISGLTDGSLNQSATALARAAAAAGVPQILTNPYPEDGSIAPGSVILNYRSRGVPEDDQSVYLYADFDRIQPSGASATPNFIVSDDCSVMSETRQFFPGTRIPLTVEWQDPNDDASAPVTRTATMEFDFSLRKLVLSGIIRNSNINTFRAAVTSVNDDTFMGLPKGYWKFARLATQQYGLIAPTDPSQQPSPNDPNQPYQITAELISKQIEDWRQFALFDTEFGWAQVSDDDVATINGFGYVDDIKSVNGIIAVGFNPLADFRALFGFS